MHSATHSHTYKDRLSATASKLAHQREAALTSSVRGVPVEINRGHPRAALPLAALLASSFQTPTETVLGPHVDEEELWPNSSRETRHKEGTYLAVVHLPHNASKDREHTYTVSRTPACATRPKAIRNTLLWEYITHSITYGHTAQHRSNMLEYS